MNQFLQCFFLSALVLALSQAAEVGVDVCTTGTSQSPVNLDSTSAEKPPTSMSIRFNWERVGKDFNAFTENTGTSVEFSFPKGEAHIILDGKNYKLEKARYHWGSSEHSVDGKFFDGEIELFHLESGGSGIAIVSILLTKSQELAPSQEYHELSGFKSTLKYVKYPGSKHTTIFNTMQLAFEHMLPVKKDFFRYVGSLSAAPCTEGVERIVFKQPILATEDFFSQLLTLEGNDGEAITKNARQVQDSAVLVYKHFTGKQA